MDAVDALGRLPMFRGDLQPVADVDSLQDEDASLDLDFTHGGRNESFVAGGNLTRLQRASQSSGQSSGGGSNHVIDGRGMRIVNVGVDFVVLGHGSVDSEEHRLLLRRKVRPPQRALDSFDADLGSIG